MSDIKVGEKSFAGSFNFYDFLNPIATAKYIAPVDINGDGVDEVLFYGFESQPNTPQNYSNTSVHVFGWDAGVFKEITSQWLPGDTNKVEGVGDVAFGDFNKDGLTDVFLSAYADMEYTVNAYQLINRGSYFDKISLGSTSAWQHGVASADINHDGFSDVYSAGYGAAPQIYIGGPGGFDFRKIATDSFSGGSGIALGDFLDNGEVSVIFVDHIASSGRDTALYTIVANSDSTYSLSFVSALPTPRLDGPEYGPLPNEWGHSHDIRARPFDFDGDGLLDVLVFSRMNGDTTNGGWPEISEIQFLKNLGTGRFADVTDSVLIGYDNNTNAPYNPIIRDLNGDGLLDIYMDDETYSSSHDSATILLHQPDGTFVDTGRDELSSIVNSNGGGLSNVLVGPDGNVYAVSLVTDYQTKLQNVYINQIGSPTEPISRVNGDEILVGDNSSNAIFGYNGNDKITGLGGDDVVDGGTGIDTLVLTGAFSQYSINLENATVTDTLHGRDGVDAFMKIERLQFTDTSIALDKGLWTNAGSAYRLYKAAFDRAPDEVGLGYWIDKLDDGASLQLAASGFIHSAEFESLYGANPSDTLFLTKLYNNVLDRDPDVGGLNYWINQINGGMSRESALINFSESNENVSNVADLIANGIQYQAWLG